MLWICGCESTPWGWPSQLPHHLGPRTCPCVSGRLPTEVSEQILVGSHLGVSSLPSAWGASPVCVGFLLCSKLFASVQKRPRRWHCWWQRQSRQTPLRAHRGSKLEKKATDGVLLQPEDMAEISGLKDTLLEASAPLVEKDDEIFIANAIVRNNFFGFRALSVNEEDQLHDLVRASLGKRGSTTATLPKSRLLNIALAVRRGMQRNLASNGNSAQRYSSSVVLFNKGIRTRTYRVVTRRISKYELQPPLQIVRFALKDRKLTRSQIRQFFAELCTMNESGLLKSGQWEIAMKSLPPDLVESVGGHWVVREAVWALQNDEMGAQYSSSEAPNLTREVADEFGMEVAEELHALAMKELGPLNAADRIEFTLDASSRSSGDDKLFWLHSVNSFGTGVCMTTIRQLRELADHACSRWGPGALVFANGFSGALASQFTWSESRVMLIDWAQLAEKADLLASTGRAPASPGPRVFDAAGIAEDIRSCPTRADRILSCALPGARF